MNTSFTIGFVQKHFKGVDIYLAKNFDGNKKNSEAENIAT
jgi:hypothetical protein